MDSNEAIGPLRKGVIPEDAFWVGGTESGNWYQVVDVHPHRNNAIVKIFNANTGSLIMSKKFFLVCAGEKGDPIWIDDLKSQILSFDGERIHLKRSQRNKPCWLQ